MPLTTKWLFKRSQEQNWIKWKLWTGKTSKRWRLTTSQNFKSTTLFSRRKNSCPLLCKTSRCKYFKSEGSSRRWYSTSYFILLLRLSLSCSFSSTMGATIVETRTTSSCHDCQKPSASYSSSWASSIQLLYGWSFSGLRTASSTSSTTLLFWTWCSAASLSSPARMDSSVPTIGRSSSPAPCRIGCWSTSWSWIMRYYMSPVSSSEKSACTLSWRTSRTICS